MTSAERFPPRSGRFWMWLASLLLLGHLLWVLSIVALALCAQSIHWMDKFVVRLPKPADVIEDVFEDAAECRLSTECHAIGATPVLVRQGSSALRGGSDWRFSYTHPELKGSLAIWHKHYFIRKSFQAYQQLLVCPVASGRLLATNQTWQAQVLPHAARQFSFNRWARGTVRSVEFDEQGYLLVAARADGRLAVFNHDKLAASAGPAPSSSACQPEATAQAPDDLACAYWNPTNQDEVVCAGPFSSEVWIYNFGLAQDTPCQVLRQKDKSNAPGERARVQDVACFKLGRHRVAAASESGAVYLWDTRTAHRSSKLEAVRGADTLNTVELSADEQVVFAGGANGVVYSWDIRGGRSAAFSSTWEEYHPPLSSLNISSGLDAVPTLRDQAIIASSAIHAINLDPWDHRQLGFHLNNGWSGSIDLNTWSIAHVHCPPPPWDCIDDIGQENQCAGVMRARCPRRPTWVKTESMFCAPSAADNAVVVIDFARHPLSQSYLHNARGCTLEGNKATPISIPTASPVSSVAVHPATDDIVAGTESGQLLLLGHRWTSVSDNDDCCQIQP
eukprot:jgi/Chlat1/5670/Chrsp37S05469